MLWFGAMWSGRQRASGYLRKGLLGLLGTLVLFGGAHAATTPPTLLVLGDSLSAGYGIKVEQGWVALLRQRLQVRGYGYQVINASVSGETTQGGKARLPALLKQHQPRIVLIELGANDGLRGLPLTAMRSNLAAMIKLSRSAGAQVVLVGMQLPGNYGATYTAEFAAVYAELAREYRLPWVPFLLEGVALVPALMQADDLHPNAEAQPKLLDTVWPVLVPSIKK